MTTDRSAAAAELARHQWTATPRANRCPVCGEPARHTYDRPECRYRATYERRRHARQEARTTSDAPARETDPAPSPTAAPGAGAARPAGPREPYR